MADRIRFRSGATVCAATLYRSGTAGAAPCLVMGHGFAGTQDQLAPMAAIFAELGLTVLTFDYRHFGASGGQPRQLVSVARQYEDWKAAVALARSLPDADPKAIALWGTSFAAGHVLRLAAEDPAIRAVVAQVPEFGLGSGSVIEEIRIKRERKKLPLSVILRAAAGLLGAAARDQLRGLRRQPPYYLPVFAPPGRPGAVIDGEYQRFLTQAAATGPTWRNEFTPRVFFHPPSYRPGTAERVAVPLLVCIASEDTVTNPRTAAAIARAAPEGILREYPCGHFEVYNGSFLQTLVNDQARFLTKALKP